MIVAISAVHAKSGGGLWYMSEFLPALGRLAAPEDRFIVFGRSDQAGLVGEAPPSVLFSPVGCPNSALGTALWEQMVLPLLLRRSRADVLFCPANYGPVLTSLPTVLLLRNSLAAARQARGLFTRARWATSSWITRASIRRAARLMAVSETLAEELRSLFRIDPSVPIPVVPHGVHPRFTPEPRGPHPLADSGGGRYFLFVSDLYRHKNLPALVRAFGEVAPHLPDCRLAIVGGHPDPRHSEEVREEAGRSGVADRIFWKGPLPQTWLPDWYRHALALVFPSFAESFGKPPLEAMACGTPVLASKAGAMPEVCGQAAAYFAPEDIGSLAALMLRVASDRECAADLSRRGLERARLFSWEGAAGKVLPVLRNAVRTTG